MSANIGYARVSTFAQSLDEQLDALRKAGCKKVFEGKQSGDSSKNDDRIADMLDYIREGDIVHVTRLDRLGRSTRTILNTIHAIHDKSATLRTLDGAIDTSQDSPFAQIQLSLLSAFAQLERDMIIERTKEGRLRAQAEGKSLGRRKTISDADRKIIRKKHAKGEPKLRLSKEYGVSRTTIKRIIEEVQDDG